MDTNKNNMKNSDNPTSLSAKLNASSNTPVPLMDSDGLANLQKYTSDILDTTSSQWGFASSNLKVNRHKLDNNTWQLTVVNPKTLKTILQAEGNGDTVFEHEDNLARMAETLMAQGLTIRTQFNE